MSLAESLDILFEDNHCIAVNKPAGWPTTHFAGEQTVDRLVKDYLKEKHKKPGNVFLGVVHRLDKPASGVLLFARTSKAAARLSQQFREAAVEKVYWAVVDCGLRIADCGLTGSFDDWLLRDDDNAITRVVKVEVEGAQRAVTHYSKRAEHGGMTLLELRPQTGRKHQLRAQLASRGMPIHGDRKYGSTQTLGNSIALHERTLTFLHPVRHEPVTLTADVPQIWKGRFAHLLRTIT
jgi:23S rRNA pseudouridine1911/1915/1917 synthase